MEQVQIQRIAIVTVVTVVTVVEIAVLVAIAVVELEHDIAFDAILPDRFAYPFQPWPCAQHEPSLVLESVWA